MTNKTENPPETSIDATLVAGIYSASTKIPLSKYFLKEYLEG